MLRLLIPLLFLFTAFPVLAQDNTQGDHVSLAVYADRDSAVPGETVTLALEQTIAPGWHTYWVNPGDSGQAMRVTWDDGIEAGDTQWPVPGRMPYGPLVDYGYHDKATMLVDVRLRADLKGETVTLSGKANILVCIDICVPEDETISLTLPVGATSKPANEDIFSAARAHLPKPADWPMEAVIQDNKLVVTVTPNRLYDNTQ